MLCKVEGQTHLMHLCELETSSILRHNDKNEGLDKQSRHNDSFCSAPVITSASLTLFQVQKFLFIKGELRSSVFSDQAL